MAQSCIYYNSIESLMSVVTMDLTKEEQAKLHEIGSVVVNSGGNKYNMKVSQYLNLFILS